SRRGRWFDTLTGWSSSTRAFARRAARRRPHFGSSCGWPQDAGLALDHWQLLPIHGRAWARPWTVNRPRSPYPRSWGLPASNMLSRSNGPAELTVSRKGFWAEMILTLVGGGQDGHPRWKMVY